MERNSLYILGGSSGDVDNSDTDHFDESVIIHEYGHFLEKHFWRSDSPGGFHNGNMIIDPRLAFSEGFANFLPSAVLGNPKYIDTVGTPDRATSVGVYLNLESEPTAPELIGDGIRDAISSYSPIGEGIYREVSVSRALWDYVDSAKDSIFNSQGESGKATDSAEISFAYLWLALTNNVFGLNASVQHFVSMGHFNKALYQAVRADGKEPLISDLDTARNGEFQTADLSAYATPLITGNSSCFQTITPVPDRVVASLGASITDLFRSHDFYQIQHSGGVFQLSLMYSTNSNVDLDLYVYKEDHNLSDRDDLVAASDKERWSESPTGSEAVAVTLPAGNYLVLVATNTSDIESEGRSASYQLKKGESYQCPSP